MARTAQQLKALGLPTWDHGHAQYFERLLENLGWDDKQVDAALKFGAEFKGNEQELRQQFLEVAEFVNAPDPQRAVTEAGGLMHLIATDDARLQSVDFAEPAFNQDDSARLAELREMARNDPDGFDRDKSLQEEQLAILAAQQASGGGDGKVQEVNSPAPPPSGDRLAEIRNIARNDPDRFDRSPALQQEQQTLIAASLPASTPADATPSGAATSNASEGTPT